MSRKSVIPTIPGLLGLLFSLALGAGTALAQAPAAPPTPYPTAFLERPLTNPKGMIEIRGNTVQLNLSKDAVGKPVSLAPAIYYGITDSLTVGLTHATGICLTGSENGCIKVYNDVGLDVQYYAISEGRFLLVPHGGFTMSSFDPALAEVNVAVLAQLSITSWLGLFVEPLFTIALNDRTNAARDRMFIPVTLGFQATPRLYAYLTSGIGGLFDGFGDSYSLPLALGGLYAITPMIDVGAEFAFPNIGGKGGSADLRALTLRAAFRF
jgi:hypothetical protein